MNDDNNNSYKSDSFERRHADQQEDIFEGDASNRLELTDEQRTHIEQLFRERLGREKARAQREIESIRVAAQRAASVAPAPNGTPTNVQGYLESGRQQVAAEASEREGVAVYFGPHSSGVAAAKLMKESPALYKQMKERAIYFGLLSGKTANPNAGKVRNAFPIAK